MLEKTPPPISFWKQQVNNALLRLHTHVKAVLWKFNRVWAKWLVDPSTVGDA